MRVILTSKNTRTHTKSTATKNPNHQINQNSYNV